MTILADIEKINPARSFNMTYILLDIIFLAFLITLVCIKKKYLTLCWSLFGGLLYLMVDFGIFYLATHTRHITINGNELDTLGHFLFLLWFSFSYGVPNFIFIWMCLNKDKDLILFTCLIFGWWMIVPSLSKFGEMDCFKNTFLSYTVTTIREGKNFHWVMSLFLVVGYGSLIAYYLIKDRQNFKKDVKTVLILNAIGISTQLMWELPLLVNGIRPINDTSFQTLVLNCLIETNSGMVYFYLFHKLMTQKLKIGENLKVNRSLDNPELKTL